MKTWLTGTIILLLAALALVSQASAANLQAMTIGRVYFVEGDLLRYIPADNDWVPMVNDTPFAVEDSFFSSYQGRAEMFVPNGTWIRVGYNTQIQFIALDSDLSEVDVSSGVARFNNKGSETVIKATSPFGYVIAYPGTAFDFYIGENSVEVVAVKGTVSFIHAKTDTRYDVAADSPSILADDGQVTSGDGAVEDDWHRWNIGRENFWDEKSRLTGRSVEFLPASLRGDSYALEENGRWESIHYEGASRWFWRPTTIRRGWSPFTAGRWTDWYGDQVWIPSEPFGYVTHHYGNWIYIQNSWYWAPPVASLRVGHSLLDIGFFWSPGRVSWVHHDNYVGWVVLGPRETYYSHRRWGGAHDTLYTGNFTRISINIDSYAYARQAIIVPRDHFYRVDDYRTVRVDSINTATIINNYNAAPVINNYQTDTRRHTLTSRVVMEKPHVSVLSRIETNQAVIRRGQKENSATVLKQVRNVREGRRSRDGAIEAPISTNYIVPASEVNRPISELKLQQKKIKAGSKSRGTAEQGQVPTGQGAHQGEPDGQTRQVAPARPTQPDASQQPANEEPLVRQQKKAPVAPTQKAKPEKDVVERPRQGKQPQQAVEQSKEQPQQKATGKKAEKAEPARDPVERLRQGKQPQQAVEQSKKQPQQKATSNKPGKAQPTGDVVERSRQNQQPGTSIAQPEGQEPDEVPVNNEQETELT
jgi:hypothetical protein